MSVITTVTTISINQISFNHQLLLVILGYIPQVLSIVFILIIFKKLPTLMESIYRFTKSKSDYQCQCDRCKNERNKQSRNIKNTIKNIFRRRYYDN